MGERGTVITVQTGKTQPVKGNSSRLNICLLNQSISTISRSMTSVWFTVDARSITVGLSVVIFHCADEMRRLVGTRTKGRGGCLWFCLIALEMLMVISCVCFHTASLEFSNSAL